MTVNAMQQSIQLARRLGECYRDTVVLLGSEGFNSATAELRGCLDDLMATGLLPLKAGVVLIDKLKAAGELTPTRRMMICAVVFSLYVPKVQPGPMAGPNQLGDLPGQN